MAALQTSRNAHIRGGHGIRRNHEALFRKTASRWEEACEMVVVQHLLAGAQQRIPEGVIYYPI